MLQTMRAATDSNHTHIRLATAPNRGAMIYSQIYKQFSHRYPDISLTLTELYASDQPNAILHGQIDLAIGSGKISDKVTDLPIAYEELLVSLPVSHPLALTKRIRLSDLRDTPFVLQGPRHSIRILAEELFKEHGFHPVVSFESNDVLLVDSMLHQAVGVGLVSQAHVFPCDELVYRSLEPPIYQTLHLRYPLGHTLTEPERYLAGLLAHERLSDPRYQPIQSSEVEDLLRLLEQEPNGISESEHSDHMSAQIAAAYYKAPELNLNSQLLRYIIAIVDEKSLTKAAEKFYLTQPALSRHLRNVENMLCTNLFTRVHNRLQPTNAGKIFVNFARNMLQIEAEMEEHIHDYRIGHGGGIYLHCDPMLTSLIQKAVTPEFHKHYPDIQLTFIENTRKNTEEALLNASADYGLYFSCEKEHAILSCEILAQSELVYCFASKTPTKQPIHPHSSFMSARPIMLAPTKSALRIEQERLISEFFDTPPTIVCEAQIEILQILAAQGAADTILPVHYVPSEALPRCCSFKQPQNWFLLLAHHPGRTLPPSVHELVRLLKHSLNTFFSIPL